MLVDGVKGRYVRLYSNGYTFYRHGNRFDPFNHYTEVMVYGQPVEG